MVIGIDYGYSAIKTRQVCFQTGITRYEYAPYTMQNVLQYKGRLYIEKILSAITEAGFDLRAVPSVFMGPPF